jgi:hypothetical protein
LYGKDEGTSQDNQNKKNKYGESTAGEQENETRKKILAGARCFCFKKCPDLFWGPHNLLFNGYLGLVLRG